MAEARAIEQSSTEVLKKLKAQIAHNYSIPFYRKRMDEGGIKPEDIRSFDDFCRIPFMKREDQVASFEEDPPLGSMWDPDTVLITHTPAPGIGLVPEYHTRADIDACALAVAKRLGAQREVPPLLVVGGKSPPPHGIGQELAVSLRLPAHAAVGRRDQETEDLPGRCP